MTADLAGLLERIEKAEWRPVPGWPYEASDCGLLRSIRTGRILRPTETDRGYLHCCFQVDYRRKDVRVHRAIVEAWVGPIPPGFHVNHIDGNKQNNAVSNLEIVTAAENDAHAARLGLKATGDRNGMRRHPNRRPRGENQGLSKLTADQVLSIRHARDNRLATLDSLAAQYGVDRSLISQIGRRKIWTHI